MNFSKLYLYAAAAMVIFALGAGLFVWYIVQHVDAEVRKGDVEALMPVPKTEDTMTSDPEPVPVIK